MTRAPECVSLFLRLFPHIKNVKFKLCSQFAVPKWLNGSEKHHSTRDEEDTHLIDVNSLGMTHAGHQQTRRRKIPMTSNFFLIFVGFVSKMSKSHNLRITISTMCHFHSNRERGSSSRKKAPKINRSLEITSKRWIICEQKKTRKNNEFFFLFNSKSFCFLFNSVHFSLNGYLRILTQLKLF